MHLSYLLAEAAGAAATQPAAADHHQLLADIGVAVLAATVLGLISHLLRQPIILGYLVAGAVIGPTIGLKLIHGRESIEIIAEIGLVLLLFIIGLEMNVKALLASGRQLLVAGFGQFPVCALLGVGLFWLLGYGLRGTKSDGLYLALMCGLSSTAVVVKLLYDKGELDTLSGRMTLGILVVQDIFAIFILAFQPNFSNPTYGPVIRAVLGTVALLVVGFLVSKYALRWIFQAIAKAPEMVVAVSIGWCAAVAAVADWLQLSKEMGALVAGLSIAAFPYSVHVTAKTLPLRDFFLTLFFVSLGMKIAAPTAGGVAMALLVVAFIIVSRFLSVYPLLRVSGAGRRTAFVTSVNLAQMSEFSLVIASLGVDKFHHIASGTLDMAIYAMAITAVMSSYTIRYNHQLYGLYERVLERWRPKPAPAPAPAGGEEGGEAAHRPVAVLGFHRGARSLVDVLARREPQLLGKLLVVDYNPEVVSELKGRGVHAMFGDIGSLDTLHHAHLHHARLILCTIPDMLLKGTDNETLVRASRTLSPHATIVANADDDAHEQVLRREGAGLVIKPYSLIAEQLAAAVARAVAEDEADGHVGEPPGDGEAVATTAAAVR